MTLGFVGWIQMNSIGLILKTEKDKEPRPTSLQIKQKIKITQKKDSILSDAGCVETSPTLLAKLAKQASQLQ